MARKQTQSRKGTSLDDWLEEEGMLEEVNAVALKRVFAYQLEQAMEKRHITKAEMSKLMNTSRSSLDRLLDSGNTSVTLKTMSRAAGAVGKKLKVELVG